MEKISPKGTQMQIIENELWLAAVDFMRYWVNISKSEVGPIQSLGRMEEALHNGNVNENPQIRQAIAEFIQTYRGSNRKADAVMAALLKIARLLGPSAVQKLGIQTNVVKSMKSPKFMYPLTAQQTTEN